MTQSVSFMVVGVVRDSNGAWEAKDYTPAERRFGAERQAQIFRMRYGGAIVLKLEATADGAGRTASILKVSDIPRTAAEKLVSHLAQRDGSKIPVSRASYD